MAMIKCPGCGQDVSDMADKCVHCGMDLKKEIEDKIICNECGKENAANAQICAFCGYPLKNEEESTDIEKKDRKKKKRVFLIVVIIVLIGIISIGINGAKNSGEEKAYKEAIQKIEDGEYDEGKIILEKIQDYEGVNEVLEQIEWEQIAYECIPEFVESLNVPDSLVINDITFLSSTIKDGLDDVDLQMADVVINNLF